MNKKREVKSSVKDESLIEKRREQMIRGAVKLFKEKGFHRTTTREIAKEAGFSIGTLYEYIRTKEDVLYFSFVTAFTTKCMIAYLTCLSRRNSGWTSNGNSSILSFDR